MCLNIYVVRSWRGKGNIIHVIILVWTLTGCKNASFCSISAEQGSCTRSDSGHYNTEVHPVKFCLLRQVWPGKTALDYSFILARLPRLHRVISL